MNSLVSEAPVLDFSWCPNEDRTGAEQTRTLFDLVRAAFASSRTACTDLSRRLRDGVSLIFSISRPVRLYAVCLWPGIS